MPTSILIINPNSSQSVSAGLEEALRAPPDTTLSFYTAPANAPPSINNATEGVLSAALCFQHIVEEGLIDKHDGFLVSCFSEHPLVGMLRNTTTKPVIGILHASVIQALLCGERFGIVATGRGYRYDRYAEVQHVLGGKFRQIRGVGAERTGGGGAQRGRQTACREQHEEGKRGTGGPGS
ncbi:Protein of Asp Glu hydantoin racemase family [Mycena sanguinolenta]|uniref:Protein of Asp Glu hydantoin racemase family n=1 Tax=Mycena sanguinolenta TaxID=230812 RepID=A0A8H7CJD4_9AGAR|nr:Protein of Asp Glu hydantoin racemase family [Mycena sanguinolenta]